MSNNDTMTLEEMQKFLEKHKGLALQIIDQRLDEKNKELNEAVRIIIGLREALGSLRTCKMYSGYDSTIERTHNRRMLTRISQIVKRAIEDFGGH